MPLLPACGLVRARVTKYLPYAPLVIQAFSPFSTHSSPSTMAVVFIDPASDPELGSVRPKPPMASPPASSGSTRCFRSSEPYFWIGQQQTELLTDMVTEIDGQTAASSSTARQ